MARDWNEEVLHAIRNDLARPTVHARNLFHTSIAMHDAWAAYAPGGNTYLLGQTVGSYSAPFSGIPAPDEVTTAQEEALSYAVYRLLQYRFANSPGWSTISASIDSLMAARGYDTDITSQDYLTMGAPALGNYLAQQIIEFGLTDGSNEINGFANSFYTAINPPIAVEQTGNPTMADPNHWQAIELSNAVDQAGNPIFGAPPHLSPEWGNVLPFALTEDERTEQSRDGHTYSLYLDPGPPPYLEEGVGLELDSPYKWNFALVSIWQSHHDPADGVLWDISPASIGNLDVADYPETFLEYQNFYDLYEGGDPGQGHAVNPVTGQPYEPQMVPRADYARILAEFWADGIDSETPPGHWFEIFNTTMDHPLFELQWMGEGAPLTELEFRVKAYLTLGGAMHDAAIAAWSAKGFYDYPRPVSTLRYMADRGQSSDTDLPNYHPDGIPLIPGYIELIEAGDELAGDADEHVNKIKLYTWRGPDFIADPESDIAGVGWIRAENWWPYQQPNFVTPPFAGYVSGHSTYSRAAAEVLSLITGSPYFPGGMGEFPATQNSYLEFEQGPSVDVTLQWATYRDASDQCSLSRIWGGIHPPADDIPGRLMGAVVGPAAVERANAIIEVDRPHVIAANASVEALNANSVGEEIALTFVFDRLMDMDIDPLIQFPIDDPTASMLTLADAGWSDASSYVVTYTMNSGNAQLWDIAVQVSGAEDLEGSVQKPFVAAQMFLLDTQAPSLTGSFPEVIVVNDDQAATGSLTVDFVFNEAMDPGTLPTINPIHSTSISGSISYDVAASEWIQPHTLRAAFELNDTNQQAIGVGFSMVNATDLAGNPNPLILSTNVIDIDTRNPLATAATLTPAVLNLNDVGAAALVVDLTFDKAMDISTPPQLALPALPLLSTALAFTSSEWTGPQTATLTYDLNPLEVEFFDFVPSVAPMKDLAGNLAVNSAPLAISIDTRAPLLEAIVPSGPYVNLNSAMAGSFAVEMVFDEAMNTGLLPEVLLNGPPALDAVLDGPTLQSSWLDAFTFEAIFEVTEVAMEEEIAELEVLGAQDVAGNTQTASAVINPFQIDMVPPAVAFVTASTYVIGNDQVGAEGLTVFVGFTEAMRTDVVPVLNWVAEDALDGIFTLNNSESQWNNPFTYKAVYEVFESEIAPQTVGLSVQVARDEANNTMEESVTGNLLFVDFGTLESNTLSAPQHEAKIYPSPASSGSAISIQTAMDLQGIRMTDLTGAEMLYTQQLLADENVYQLELPRWPAGTYLCQLIGRDTHIQTLKLVVVP